MRDLLRVTRDPGSPGLCAGLLCDGIFRYDHSLQLLATLQGCTEPGDHPLADMSYLMNCTSSIQSSKLFAVGGIVLKSALT